MRTFYIYLIYFPVCLAWLVCFVCIVCFVCRICLACFVYLVWFVLSSFDQSCPVVVCLIWFWSVVSDYGVSGSTVAWLVCLSGWSFRLVDLSVWLGCSSGWSVCLVGLPIWLVCLVGLSIWSSVVCLNILFVLFVLSDQFVLCVLPVLFCLICCILSNLLCLVLSGLPVLSNTKCISNWIDKNLYNFWIAGERYILQSFTKLHKIWLWYQISHHYWTKCSFP